METVREILILSFLVLLCAGSAVGILLGFGMLLKPERIVFWNQYFSRWVGTQKINEQLDRPRWIERYFYRHHRLIGSFLLIGAIFILYVFMFSYQVQKFSAGLPGSTRWLWEAVTAMLLVGGVLAALIGLIVFTRPSLLRDIEKSSNRWISSERLVKFSDMRYSIDEHILRHRKIAGAFMIVGGLYVLIIMAQFFWRSGW